MLTSIIHFCRIFSTWFVYMIFYGKYTFVLEEKFCSFLTAFFLPNQHLMYEIFIYIVCLHLVKSAQCLTYLLMALNNNNNN